MQFTDADRDTRGFIRVAPPAPADRRLADLLPPDPAAAPLEPPRPARVATRAHIAGAIVACLIGLLAVLYVAQRVPTPAATPLTRPSTHPAAPSMQPAAPATAAPAGAALARPVGAFAAPDGAYLGIIESGRPYTATARLGVVWTQIEAPGSGRVWVRAGELAPDPALPDLATPTPRPLPTSVPAPVVIYKEAPPPPTQCARVNGGGVSIERCGSASLDELQAQAQQAWNEQFSGNRVSVATMTPYSYGGKP